MIYEQNEQQFFFKQTLITKEYLKEHWGATKILGKKNYENILHLLMVSSMLLFFITFLSAFWQ